VADEVPRILAGRYEIGDLIGRGGMAEVHIGHDTRLGRTVAIKVLRSDLARDPTFQARFRREAQAAASLNHPAIVAVYDTGEDQVTEANGSVSHVPFIVMEYVEGHTVRDILQDGSAVPIDEAIEITTGVLSALEYSHHAGIIHRDIKPANVMLTPTGAVKVMDFGIARAVADAAGSITQTQAVIGTAQYLSPEQARGETVDARSDLYSTGCLFFELLTGRPPFVGDSAISVAYQHVREAAPHPSTYAADVPEVLDRITVKALAKERDARYGSAAEFRADLEAAARGGAVGAPAIVAGGAAALAAQAGPVTASTQVFSPGAAATQVGGAAPVPGWSPIGAHAAPSSESYLDDEDSSHRRGLMWALIALGVLAVGAIVALLALTNSGGTVKPKQVTFQSLDGMTEAAAKQELETARLQFGRNQEASDTVDAGKVTRSVPPGGTQVAPGSTVQVWISTGKNSFALRDLKGYAFSDAQAYLALQGLVLGTPQREDDPIIEKDRVTRSDPPAGTTVSPGATITLFQSSGYVQLPNVVGMTRQQAQDALNKLKLTVNWQSAPSDVTPDQVIAQDRQSGPVTQGTAITLTYAVPPPPPTTVAVPPVAGKNQAQANKDLTDAGLTVTQKTESTIPLTGPVAKGSPTRTVPAAGTTVPIGSNVDLYTYDPAAPLGPPA
jgi:serine/threonine-protein kinase